MAEGKMDEECIERRYYVTEVGGEEFTIDIRYQNLKRIGDGSYGFVASAHDMLFDIEVAVKKVPNVFFDLIDAKRILREIKLLRHFQGHENIVAIYDIMTIPPNTMDFNDVYIVTNLMESDLERIISSKQTLSDQHFQYFLYQVLRGLKYIHSASVLHRDLKPSNLIVNANCDLRICDFGLGRAASEDDDPQAMTEYVVTRWYRAPELLCESTKYDAKVDIWSVGCIFAEMLWRKPFLPGTSPMDQLNRIVRQVGVNPEDDLSFIRNEGAKQRIRKFAADSPPPDLASLFPKSTSPQAVDLIRRMLEFNPNTRISVEEALEHPYLTELHGQMEEPSCEEGFNTEFERQYGASNSGEIPKETLQEIMYSEMVALREDLEQDEDTDFSILKDLYANAANANGADGNNGQTGGDNGGMDAMDTTKDGGLGQHQQQWQHQQQYLQQQQQQYLQHQQQQQQQQEGYMGGGGGGGNHPHGGGAVGPGGIAAAASKDGGPGGGGGGAGGAKGMGGYQVVYDDGTDQTETPIMGAGGAGQGGAEAKGGAGIAPMGRGLSAKLGHRGGNDGDGGNAYYK